MNHVQEVAKSIVAEMENYIPDDVPETDRMIVADTYKKLAIMDYANFLRRSGERTRDHNERCIEQAYFYYFKAIQLGIPEERLENVFSGLRSYWSKKLAGVKE